MFALRWVLRNVAVFVFLVAPVFYAWLAIVNVLMEGPGPGRESGASSVISKVAGEVVFGMFSLSLIAAPLALLHALVVLALFGLLSSRDPKLLRLAAAVSALIMPAALLSLAFLSFEFRQEQSAGGWGFGTFAALFFAALVLMVYGWFAGIPPSRGTRSRQQAVAMRCVIWAAVGVVALAVLALVVL